MKLNFNPFAQKNYPPKLDDYMWMHMGWDRIGHGLETPEWVDYEVSGGGSVPPELTISIDESLGLTWWDSDGDTGRAVTMEDLYTARIIDFLAENPDRSGNAPELVDDYTLKLKANQPRRADTYAVGELEGMMFRTPRWQWQEEREGLEDATTASEVQSVTASIGKRNIGVTDALGYAPFRIDQVSGSKVQMVLVEDHPFADRFNYDKLEFLIGGESKVAQMAINDRLDFGPDTLERRLGGSIGEIPEHIQTIGAYANGEQYKLHLNWNNKHLGRLNVRRAMHEIIDVEEVYNTSPMWGRPATYQTGMGKPMSENILGQEFLDKLYDYSFTANEEGATEFMEEAGYTMESGTWTGPDGDPAQIEFHCSNWSSWAANGKVIDDQLKQFGFETNLLIYNDDEWRTEMYNYNFDMTPWWGGFGPLSAYDLDETSETGHYTSVNTEPTAPADIDNPEDYTSQHGKPLIYEIPTEVGALDLSGETETINWLEEWKTFTSTSGEEATREFAEKMARIHNFYLPDINLTDVTAGNWGDTKNYDWPEESSEHYKRGNYGTDYIIQYGHAPAKTE
ncbi:ABC transporter substrate-binding protein [Halosimplex pelagicum]|uniref:Solute-binding protein family 5 domain-containing protein n=1 Tax=Halosimplex pelagicum TaxID=869886 RepID=A0A7D5TGS9_9EURY|nr:ABC transporter substrate-binding protein [Halosimplex pelagicum]QLH81996.1 hypothetical protein HZS54_10360 [Halosimplex pelagicum]